MRYLRGPYVSAHQDTEAILATLQPVLDPPVFTELARANRTGCPRLINATATDANFWKAVEYGNHKSVSQEPTKTRKSIIKDCGRGYALSMDARLLPFIPHANSTPLGMVDLDKAYKSPRPVFDSSFCASIDSFAINDWTDKDNKPGVAFAKSYGKYLAWTWNVRISYPNEEIYAIDNDMASGFRHLKYHPRNLVAMHTSICCVWHPLYVYRPNFWRHGQPWQF
jgi:hypothetical protein